MQPTVTHLPNVRLAVLVILYIAPPNFVYCFLLACVDDVCDSGEHVRYFDHTLLPCQLESTEGTEV